jgi:hypothetical protein
LLQLLGSIVPRIDGFLHVLDVADRVLNSQVATTAQNTIAQRPISGFDYNSDKKIVLFFPVYVS